MVLDKEEKVCWVLEFKRAIERYGGTQERTRQKAERQHENLVRGLSKALDGGEWRVTLAVFVGGMCDSVEETVFNANIELMGVIERKRNAIRKRHVWKLLGGQDRVLRSYYAQREGFDRGGHETQGQTGLGKEHVRSRSTYLKDKKEKWIGYAGAGAGGLQPKVETQHERGRNCRVRQSCRGIAGLKER